MSGVIACAIEADVAAVVDDADVEALVVVVVVVTDVVVVVVVVVVDVVVVAVDMVELVEVLVVVCADGVVCNSDGEASAQPTAQQTISVTASKIDNSAFIR